MTKNGEFGKNGEFWDFGENGKFWRNAKNSSHMFNLPILNAKTPGLFNLWHKTIDI